MPEQVLARVKDDKLNLEYSFTTHIACEKLPKFCHICKVFTHNSNDCRKRTQQQPQRERRFQNARPKGWNVWNRDKPVADEGKEKNNNSKGQTRGQGVNNEDGKEDSGKQQEESGKIINDASKGNDENTPNEAEKEREKQRLERFSREMEEVMEKAIDVLIEQAYMEVFGAECSDGSGQEEEQGIRSTEGETKKSEMEGVSDHNEEKKENGAVKGQKTRQNEANMQEDDVGLQYLFHEEGNADSNEEKSRNFYSVFVAGIICLCLISTH